MLIKPVITISREIGSGGTALGRLLARRLGYALVDKELILRVAHQSKVGEGFVARYDQEEFSKGAMLLEGFFAGNHASFSSLGTGLSFPAEVGYSTRLAVAFNQDRYIVATRQLIRSLSRTGMVVLMGRGGQVVLDDHIGALHLRVVAPLEQRVKRVRRWLKLSEKEARKAIERRDKACARYLKHFYGKDWSDPQLYDLVINTGRLSVLRAAEAILHLVRGR
jgi:cytidylate kinase